MIIVLKKHSKEEQLQSLLKKLREMGLKAEKSEAGEHSVLILTGNTSAVESSQLQMFEAVKRVIRLQTPYPLAGRETQQKETVIETEAGTAIGGENFQVIAGPCSVESCKQACDVAKEVKKAGAGFYRGGVFKPRTSPYTFQGTGQDGIEMLRKAKEETGLPIVTEVTAPSQLSLLEQVDVLQVGARNMQNFELLKELGKIRKPILLKRGFSATLKEWLLSAEYVLAGGNEKVILCERGIRTFETATRYTLDFAVIPLLKTMTHLPVIVDPSHATGDAKLVKPMALAATVAGADGLMLEVHDQPQRALCDGIQALTFREFSDLMRQLRRLRELMD